MTIEVSVVVSSYNRAQLLEGTLRALVSQEVPDSLDWEIVVVDNNSSDTTAQLVTGFSKTTVTPVRYIFEPKQGISHARNRGIEEARGSIIAFIDDDVLPELDWVPQLSAAIHRWKADGIGGRILPRWEGRPPRWLIQNPRLLSHLAIMDAGESSVLVFPMKGRTQVWGANMAFRRELLEAIGGFDTGLGAVGGRLFRGEDVDLINRALQRGSKIVYDPAVTVFHRVGYERMRKVYFRKLSFYIGRGEVWAKPVASQRTFLGAPLWLYRAVFTGLWRWLGLLLLRRPGAFDQQLDWLWLVGRLSGCWTGR